LNVYLYVQQHTATQSYSYVDTYECERVQAYVCIMTTLADDTAHVA